MDLEAIIRAYDTFLDSGHDDARSVGWRNAESQAAKFAELAQVFAGDKSSFTVYDVGCGLANLSQFLRHSYPLAKYKGCDIHPGMIERARLKNPRLALECRDILRSPPHAKYDYVVASGTFNLRLKHSKPEWERYVKSMLRRCYAIAKRGMAVGFLSSFAERKDAMEYHADPSLMLKFAQQRLSPLAEVRHSQSPGHFALLVYRSRQVLARGTRK